MNVVFATVGAEYIGVQIMASYLKEAGHSVSAVCDESLFDDKNYFTIPILARIFNRRQEVINQILSRKPDIVGFSVITNGFQWALEVARGIKAQRPDVQIVMGGIHVTSVPEVVISKDCVDIICVGEGFQAIVDLANTLEQGEDPTGIPNLWFKRNGEIIRNPQRNESRDADVLPLVDKQIYEDEVPLHLSYLAMSQYGCPFACAFCAVTTVANNSKQHGGKPLQFRSVDKMIDEILLYKKKYDFSSVYFMTNTFTASKKWTLEWSKKYKEKVGLPYKIATHPTRIDDDIAVALRDSGCYTVQLGIESYSEEVRSKIFHRYETNEDIRKATDAMDRAGLRYTMDYILGAPLQGDEEYREAAKFFISRKKCIRVSPFILSFFPKTPMVEIGKKYGYLTDDHEATMNEGLDPNFISGGSVLNREKVDELNTWRFYFRIIPLLPKNFALWLLENDRFKRLRILPYGFIILFIDVLVSVFTKDYVALSYMRLYFWNFRKAAKRKFLRALGFTQNRLPQAETVPVSPNK